MALLAGMAEKCARTIKVYSIIYNLPVVVNSTELCSIFKIENDDAVVDYHNGNAKEATLTKR